MVPVVLLDACVLYSAPRRDLLMRLAVRGLFQAKWTEEILDEVFGALLTQRPDLDRDRVMRTRRLMSGALPDAHVSGYRYLVEELVLPDPDDRHVLAAAIHCQASYLVTENVKDFPEKVMQGIGIKVETSDAFVLTLLEQVPDLVIDAIRKQAAALRFPPVSEKELLDTLEKHGMPRTVARLRRQVS